MPKHRNEGSTEMADPNRPNCPVELAGLPGHSGSSLPLSGEFSVPAGVLFSALPQLETTKDYYLVIGSPPPPPPPTRGENNHLVGGRKAPYSAGKTPPPHPLRPGSSAASATCSPGTPSQVSSAPLSVKLQEESVMNAVLSTSQG